MKIGSYTIDNPVCLAPMEDVSNMAFRIICKRLGADIVYTEFTSSEALIRDAKRALDKIKIAEEERPVGIQIYGGVEESMAEAAQVAESNNPDLIDINCGCWVKNHALRGEGAGLLKDLSKFESIVKTTVNATKLPVTVKTRLGWDDKNIVILDVAKLVEDSGAKALTVHCRTRCQGYKGQADWSWLTKIKKQVSIPIIANGDITTVDDVKHLFELGCDGVMIGRGAIGNPWIFKQANHYLKTGETHPLPTLEERVDVLLEHLKLAIETTNFPNAIIPFRKYYAGYLSGFPNVAKLRADLMQIVEFDQVVDRLKTYLNQSTSLVSSK